MTNTEMNQFDYTAAIPVHIRNGLADNNGKITTMNELSAMNSAQSASPTTSLWADITINLPKHDSNPTKVMTWLQQAVDEAAASDHPCTEARESQSWKLGTRRVIAIMAADWPSSEMAGNLSDTVCTAAQSESGKHHIWCLVVVDPSGYIEPMANDQPEPNLCLGVQVKKGTETELGHVRKLATSGAALRAVIIEPSTGNFTPSNLDLNGIDLVIMGGNVSGPRDINRPFNLELAMEIAAHCANYKVPFFLNRLGSYATLKRKRIELKDPNGADWDEWPAEAPRVREFPGAFKLGGMEAQAAEPKSIAAPSANVPEQTAPSDATGEQELQPIGGSGGDIDPVANAEAQSMAMSRTRMSADIMDDDGLESPSTKPARNVMPSPVEEENNNADSSTGPLVSGDTEPLDENSATPAKGKDKVAATLAGNTKDGVLSSRRATAVPRVQKVVMSKTRAMKRDKASVDGVGADEDDGSRADAAKQAGKPEDAIDHPPVTVDVAKESKHLCLAGPGSATSPMLDHQTVPLVETEVVNNNGCPLDDLARFKDLDGRVRRGLAAFADAGAALIKMNETELYRIGGHANMVDYAKAALGIGKSQMYRIIEAARCYMELMESFPQIGENPTPLPATESLVRLLLTLPGKEERATVWKSVMASGKQPKARQVKQEVFAFLHVCVKADKPTPKRRSIPSDHPDFVALLAALDSGDHAEAKRLGNLIKEFLGVGNAGETPEPVGNRDMELRINHQD